MTSVRNDLMSSAAKVEEETIDDKKEEIGPDITLLYVCVFL